MYSFKRWVEEGTANDSSCSWTYMKNKRHGIGRSNEKIKDNDLMLKDAEASKAFGHFSI